MALQNMEQRSLKLLKKSFSTINLQHYSYRQYNQVQCKNWSLAVMCLWHPLSCVSSSTTCNTVFLLHTSLFVLYSCIFILISITVFQHLQFAHILLIHCPCFFTIQLCRRNVTPDRPVLFDNFAVYLSKNYFKLLNIVLAIPSLTQLCYHVLLIIPGTNNHWFVTDTATTKKKSNNKVWPVTYKHKWLFPQLITEVFSRYKNNR